MDNSRITNSINLIINIVLFFIIVGIAYAWMVTDSSDGEIVRYKNKLIVSSLDIDVKLYMYDDNEYKLITDPLVDLNNIAPGDVYQFRFDITNDNNSVNLSKIVFGEINGDIDELAPYLIIGSTSPNIYSFMMKDKMVKSINNDGKEISIIRFNDNLRVPAKTTLSLYWYIAIDETANNDVSEKHLTIDSIEFISP